MRRTLCLVVVLLSFASFASAEDTQLVTPDSQFVPSETVGDQEMMPALVSPVSVPEKIYFKPETTSRRRPVRREQNSVEVALSVIYLNADGTLFTGDDGKWKYCAVMMDSMRTLTTGTTFSYSVQRPGADEGDFTFIRSWTVEPHQAGFYVASKVYFQDGFYDIVQDGTPEGVKVPWLPGIGIFKVNITPPKGTETSVIQKVPVRLDELRAPLGPLQQAILSADGKSILLVGAFSTPPTAMLFQFFEDGSYRRASVSVSQNQFKVPDGWFGPGSPLTVIVGYPSAESSTVQVDIPEPPPTEGTKQLR